MPRAPKKSRRFKYALASVLKFKELRESQEQEKFNLAEKKYQKELKKEEEMKAQEQQEHIGLIEEISEGKTIDFQGSAAHFFIFFDTFSIYFRD